MPGTGRKTSPGSEWTELEDIPGFSSENPSQPGTSSGYESNLGLSEQKSSKPRVRLDYPTKGGYPDRIDTEVNTEP